MAKKQKLTDSELGQVYAIQRDRDGLVRELGEIEIQQINLDKRYENALTIKERIENFEASLSKSINEKYGNVEIDLKTGNIK